MSFGGKGLLPSDSLWRCSRCPSQSSENEHGRMLSSVVYTTCTVVLYIYIHVHRVCTQWYVVYKRYKRYKRRLHSHSFTCIAPHSFSIIFFFNFSTSAEFLFFLRCDNFFLITWKVPGQPQPRARALPVENRNHGSVDKHHAGTTHFHVSQQHKGRCRRQIGMGENVQQQHTEI